MPRQSLEQIFSQQPKPPMGNMPIDEQRRTTLEIFAPEDSRPSLEQIFSQQIAGDVTIRPEELARISGVTLPPPSPKSGGWLDTLSAPMEAASRGGAQLISNIMAPFSEESTLDTLRAAGLYDVKHPEIENQFARAVAESPLGAYNQATYSAIGAPIAPIIEKVGEAAKAIGIPQDVIELTGAAGNIIGPAGPTNPTAKVNVLGKLMNEQSNTGSIFSNNASGKIPLVKKPLPSEWQALEDLPVAAKAKTKVVPAADVGLKANQAISENYAKDVNIQQGIATTLKSHGSKFDITMPTLYNKLDDIINHLSDKVAPGSKEAIAVSQLKEVRDRLNSKYSLQGNKPLVDINPKTGKQKTFTNPYYKGGKQPVKAHGVSPNDLIDIRTSINDGLNTNRFLTSGGGKLLEFKKIVNDGLTTASKLSPDFDVSLKNFDKQAAKIGIYHEDAVKALWQPEDYVAWKANKNNPAQSPVANDTLTRSSKFLKNLNTDKAGTVASLYKILPKDMARDVVAQAIKLAREQRPSIVKAAMNLASGHPLQAIGMGLEAIKPGNNSPLLDLASQIKKMQK